MNKNELIADKIEVAIRQMLLACRSLNPGASEYTILYDPRKYASWFIVIFFTDVTIMREAIKNGTCYHLYSFLLSELSKDNELTDITRAIYFEAGIRPSEKTGIDVLLRKLISKTDSLKNNAGKDDIKVCGGCGHPFEDHQLLCNMAENDPPREGWILCPVENCTCFQTWSSNYNDES